MMPLQRGVWNHIIALSKLVLPREFCTACIPKKCHSYCSRGLVSPQIVPVSFCGDGPQIVACQVHRSPTHRNFVFQKCQKIQQPYNHEFLSQVKYIAIDESIRGKGATKLRLIERDSKEHREYASSCQPSLTRKTFSMNFWWFYSDISDHPGLGGRPCVISCF